ARMQSQLIADELEKAHPGLQVEMVIIKTTGDAITDRPLHELGGKGLFVKELELALLNGEVDFAVHSFKDLPVTMPLVDESQLVIAAVPKREDVRDVLITRPGVTATSLATLAEGANVATGSLRRRCQILQHRPDVHVHPIRGNIDTRIRKLLEDGSPNDAVILAMAGLRRAALFDAERMHAIELQELLPAAGQGALALQCRGDAQHTRDLLSQLNDLQAAQCVNVERQIVAMLQGDCHSPIAAYAQIEGQSLYLRTAVGMRDGQPPVIFAESSGAIGDAAIAKDCCDKLLAKGAYHLLHADAGAA
ncbi:MAG TPA: hydroxymethylbilane synthase, partial [Burkholderiaceae bacterium]|nr:hydroxymethylbilane synthase [Burkholderiaceae bacterium]